MSIEQALAALTAAVIANTAAITGKPAAASSPAAQQPASYTPRHTWDEMKAKLGELKEKKGVQAAKDLVANTGGVDHSDKLKGKPELIDKCYDEAEKQIKAANEDV